MAADLIFSVCLPREPIGATLRETKTALCGCCELSHINLRHRRRDEQLGGHSRVWPRSGLRYQAPKSARHHSTMSFCTGMFCLLGCALDSVEMQVHQYTPQQTPTTLIWTWLWLQCITKASHGRTPARIRMQVLNVPWLIHTDYPQDIHNTSMVTSLCFDPKGLIDFDLMASRRTPSHSQPLLWACQTGVQLPWRLGCASGV